MLTPNPYAVVKKLLTAFGNKPKVDADEDHEKVS